MTEYETMRHKAEMRHNKKKFDHLCNCHCDVISLEPAHLNRKVKFMTLN